MYYNIANFHAKLGKNLSAAKSIHDRPLAALLCDIRRFTESVVRLDTLVFKHSNIHRRLSIKYAGALKYEGALRMPSAHSLPESRRYVRLMYPAQPGVNIVG